MDLSWLPWCGFIRDRGFLWPSRRKSLIGRKNVCWQAVDSCAILATHETNLREAQRKTTWGGLDYDTSGQEPTHKCGTGLALSEASPSLPSQHQLTSCRNPMPHVQDQNSAPRRQPVGNAPANRRHSACWSRCRGFGRLTYISGKHDAKIFTTKNQGIGVTFGAFLPQPDKYCVISMASNPMCNLFAPTPVPYSRQPYPATNALFPATYTALPANRGNSITFFQANHPQS